MLTVELTPTEPDKVEPLIGFVRHRVMVYAAEDGELVLHAPAAVAGSGSRILSMSKDASTSKKRLRVRSLRA
jgi:hypothetical protein